MFKCKICDKEFEDKGILGGHISGHVRRGDCPKQIKRYFCFDCNIEFETGNNLRSHNRIVHKQNSTPLDIKISKYEEFLKIEKAKIIQVYDHSKCNVKDENPTYWLYGHYTDNGVLFYIGAGLLKRSFSLQDRNKKHKLIREKYGWTPGILAGPFKTRQEMFEAEIDYIAKYHTHVRDPQANNFACNFSIGGECTSRGAGWKLTEEQKAIHKERMNRPEVRKNISDGVKNAFKNNPSIKPHKGYRVLSEQTKQKIRTAALNRPKNSTRKQESNKKTSETLKRKALGKTLLGFYEPGSLWNY